jgi:hypothetical protein
MNVITRTFAILLMLVIPALSNAQDAPKKTLVVNGVSTPAAVVQIGGHSYVDVEAFAQAVNASVSFDGGKVTLTMPGGAAPAVPATEAKKVGLSREFSLTGIAALSDMREWRAALASSRRFGIAAGNWLAPYLRDYQNRAQKSVDQAGLTATTESDHKAAELLRNELSNVTQWDAQTQATIQSLNAEPSVNPAATDNDPLRIKIADCGTALTAMFISGQFSDNANCH